MVLCIAELYHITTSDEARGANQHMFKCIYAVLVLSTGPSKHMSRCARRRGMHADDEGRAQAADTAELDSLHACRPAIFNERAAVQHDAKRQCC